MSDKSKPSERKLSLPVLPDEKRVSRILAAAEANQERRAMESQHNSPAANATKSSAASSNESPQQQAIRQKVIDVLNTVYDPEIPVNIYELGLVYDVEVTPEGAVNIRMTLTAPACPVAESLPPEVEAKVETIPEVKSAHVLLVWDPPWDREMMSEAAKLQLGLM